jgi:hypothetical protein
LNRPLARKGADDLFPPAHKPFEVAALLILGENLSLGKNLFF